MGRHFPHLQQYLVHISIENTARITVTNSNVMVSTISSITWKLLSVNVMCTEYEK